MDASPQQVPPEPSAIWSLGMPPEIMAGFLVNFVRAHFADPHNIVDPVFRDRIWRSDPAMTAWTHPESPILIESIDRFDPRLVEVRPAVIVKDHGWRPQRMGIANRTMGTYNRDGFDVYACLYHSGATLFAVAGESKEAKKLATEITRQLVQYEEVIRCELNLVRFLVVERGECFKIEESTANFAVPITTAYIAEESWTLKPQVSRVKRIILQMTAQPGG